MSKQVTSSSSSSASIGFSGLFLVAGLIMRYAVENRPNSPVDWDVAGLICIVIGLLPMLILLGIGFIVGTVALAILFFDRRGPVRRRRRK